MIDRRKWPPTEFSTAVVDASSARRLQRKESERRARRVAAPEISAMSHHPRIERLMPAATILSHLLVAGVLFGAAGQLAVAHQVPAPPLAAVIGQADRASIDWWGLAAFTSGLSSLVLAVGTTYVRAVRVSRHEPLTEELPRPTLKDPTRGADA